MQLVGRFDIERGSGLVEFSAILMFLVVITIIAAPAYMRVSNDDYLTDIGADQALETAPMRAMSYGPDGRLQLDPVSVDASQMQAHQSLTQNAHSAPDQRCFYLMQAWHPNCDLSNAGIPMMVFPDSYGLCPTFVPPTGPCQNLAKSVLGNVGGCSVWGWCAYDQFSTKVDWIPSSARFDGLLGSSGISVAAGEVEGILGPPEEHY